jgi:uncharacterized protein (DUF736 family)
MQLVITLLLATLVATNCWARTSIDSKVLGQPTEPISTISLIYHPGQGYTPTRSASERVTRETSSKAFENEALLIEAIRNQFPGVFKTNGIDLAVYMSTTEKDRYVADAPKHRFVMHLKPVGASFTSPSQGSRLFLEAQLAELRPVHRALWTGRITIVRPGLSFLDKDWAISVAEEILDQLRRDKLLAPSRRAPEVGAGDASPSRGTP